jgi:O-acetyl-ADP-ribose deacetylase (regulator of RNase III)
MQVIEQDLFDVTGGIIAHQVNCQGVMGSGVAAIVRRKYPQAYDSYVELCQRLGPGSLLGMVQPVKVAEDLTVLNVFGQASFGAKTRNTSYDATADAWEKIASHYGRDVVIHIPYLMGCALGGGDWVIYESIVNHFCPNVVACKLPS